MLRINATTSFRRRQSLVVTTAILSMIFFECFLSSLSPFSQTLSCHVVSAQSASVSFSSGKSKTVGSSSDSSTTTTTTSASSTSSSRPPASSYSNSPLRLPMEAIELTTANFATTVNDGNVWLIEFYTSWCGHCQTFKPSYDNVALTFHSSPQEKIRVAKVDCGIEKALTTRFGVKGYPSFYVLSGWTVYEFEDSRSETALISFARGGYKKQDPIPWISSPMGPMGMLQGTMIYVGMSIMGFLETLQTKYDIPPLVTGAVICMLGIVGGLISIVLLTILSTPREKVD